MRKKLSIVLLGSVLVPANLWSQIEYGYKGTTLEKARIFATSESDLNVSETAEDDKVVYLYNPKTGRFIYPDGSWGTEAVGRYKGFGMAFNIIDPSAHEGLMDNLYFYNYTSTLGEKVGGIGFYCEAYEHGNYLGRDMDWYVGSPVYYEGGVRGVGEPQNTARFFVDRGGSGSLLKTSEWGRRDNIFTWHLEPVSDSGAPAGTKVYYLSIYMPNQPWPNEGASYEGFPKEDFFKHYVKFKKINPYGDPEGFYALTTTECNAGGTGGQSDDYKTPLSDDQIKIKGHEATPSGSDKEDYYWQIVTRKEIKQKFLDDQKDPYNAKVEDGNATLFIDNPDFSRALQKTVQQNADGNTPIYWKENNDNIYQWGGQLEPVFQSEFYGRYAFMHPFANGTLTQTFKPSQYGLFQLDIQGYTFNLFGGKGNAYMKLEQEDGSEIFITGNDEGEKGRVNIESISQSDASQIFQKIGDFARDGQLDYNDVHFGNADNHGRHVDNKSFIFTYAEGSQNPQKDGDDLITPGYKDVYYDGASWTKNPADYSGKGLYRVRWIDDYGRKCVGIYINGKAGITIDGTHYEGKVGPYKLDNGQPVHAGYGVSRDGGANWDDVDKDKPYATIEVEVGDNVVLGPSITGNGAYEGKDGHFQWWTPKGDPEGPRNYTINNVQYDDAGDYICTYHSEDSKTDANNYWNVVCYRLVVKDPKMQIATPTPANVKFNESGQSYLVNEQTSADAPAYGLETNYKATVGDRFYEDQTAYQNGIAATDIYYVERAVGEFLYNPANADKYVKSIFFYVPEGFKDKQLKLTLGFSGISDKVKDLIALDNVRLTYKGDAPYIFDETNSVDVRSKLTPEEYNVKSIPVYMNREFSINAWNAFVCPVPMNYTQLKEAFGNGVQVSEIKKDEALDSNYPYRILFKSLITNETANNERIVCPGRFYLVKPSEKTEKPSVARIEGTRNSETGAYEAISDMSQIEDGHFVPLGRHNLAPTYKSDDGVEFPTEVLSGENPYADSYSTLVATSVAELADNSPYRDFEATFVNPSDQSHNNIKLHGSYFPQEIQNRGNSYVFATKEGETRLVHLNENATATNAPVKLQGYRFYIEDVDNGVDAKPFTFVVDGVADDDEFSGISSAVSVAADNGDIYTIAGQKVTGKLLKGVYVKNGKKFLVK